MGTGAATGGVTEDGGILICPRGTGEQAGEREERKSSFTKVWLSSCEEWRDLPAVGSKYRSSLSSWNTKVSCINKTQEHINGLAQLHTIIYVDMQ